MILVCIMCNSQYRIITFLKVNIMISLRVSIYVYSAIVYRDETVDTPQMIGLVYQNMLCYSRVNIYGTASLYM